MDMNIVTLPRKGLKKYDYNIDMTTLPKKGLKTRPYNIGMDKRYLKKYDYNIDMEKKDLKKLTKGQLIKLLLKQEKKKPKVVIVDDTKPVPTPRTYKSRPPVPIPRKSVNQLVQFFENKPTPPPRTGKWENVKPKPIPRKSVNEDIILPPDHIINVPVPKIKELNKALKGHAKSYGIELQDNLNPLNHFTKTKELVESHLESLLKDKKGFKFIETLEITFEKDSIDSKTGKRVSNYKTAFFNGKAKTITKASDIEHELNMSRQDILNAIDKWVSEGSGWVIDRIDSHYINVTTYTPLHGSSYIELPTELKNPKKGLISIKNKDDECLRWCHIRQLNPQTEHPERIKKEDKKMVNKLNYDGIDFPLSQKHYNKVEKQNNIRINVFGYEKGQPFQFTYPKRLLKTK